MSDMHFIGITNEGEVAFADFGLGTRPGMEHFSARFSTVRPVCEEDIDLDRMYEDHIDDMDAGFKYELCERFGCKPSELAENVRREEEANGYEGLNACMDFSLFPETYTVNDEKWGFESAGGGQYDLRKDGMAYVVDSAAFVDLMKIWDEYHLTKNDEIPEGVKERIVALQETFPSYYSPVGEKAVDDLLKAYIDKLAYDMGERLDEDRRFTPHELEEFGTDPKYVFKRFRSEAEALCSPSLDQIGREAQSVSAESRTTVQREIACAER